MSAGATVPGVSESRNPGEAITPEGLAALRAELEELEGPGRRSMAARIKAARELGDLSENAEYHIAKDDQAHLETKIKRLRGRLQMAEVVEAGDSAESFGFGQTAEVVDDASGKVHTWTLVGPTEADLAAGRVSVESPVGRALRDRDTGESVTVETPGGERVFRVRAVLPPQRG